MNHFLTKPITLDHLDLLIVDLPQRQPFRSAVGVRNSREALLVRWVDGEGNIGYGECACRPDPFYSPEFLGAVVPFIRDFIFPFLSKKMTLGGLREAMRKARGWPFAKAAVEGAAHDLIRLRDGSSLFAEWPYEKLEKVPAGISIGLQPTSEKLVETATGAWAKGYHRLKFKISPEMGADYFRPLFEELPDAPVLFDANGSFYEKDLDKLLEFSDLGAVIEQPFPPGRFDVYNLAKSKIPKLRQCPDEEVKHLGDLMKIHELYAFAELNLKVGRVGGLLNSFEILEFCRRQKIPTWVGGMFETGVGRIVNLQVASLLPGAVAHDISPSHRYFLEDILESPVEMDENGYINVAENAAKRVAEERLEKYTVRKLEIGN